ncbi:hypothetical protein QR680_007305 [Steinernema hermaphroditum]|uniref:Carboxypeptidase n=1 Tax=Steinernema hermaphroditum TaxID=289476 RepID=A0AA39IEZ7_9BILA|nr:hypothetical protein QR680_007305 [Steinernema hermaphroditum]
MEFGRWDALRSRHQSNPIATSEMAALVILLAAALLGANADFKVNSAADDLVKDIPGLHYDPGFKTYSGYLDAGKDDQKNQGYMHYMLTESKSNPAKDPIILWLQGGPGCSGFSGAFEENGPFYMNKDGATIYENIYSWNVKANVLFFESPIGVGYSFMEGKPNYTRAHDDQTLAQNYNSLNSFFKKFTQYQNQTFFIAGESYGGIYLPMLGDKLMSGIIKKDFVNPNFAGIAIGNGYMDIVMLQNSLVLWSFYHGRISLDDWETLKSSKCCVKAKGADFDQCDEHPILSLKLNISSTQRYKPGLQPKMFLLKEYTLTDVITPPARMDQYNYYEDCYTYQSIAFKGSTGRFHQGKRESLLASSKRYHNTATVINYNSTDFEFGYPCWQETAVATYFNRPEVQKAFHVEPAKLASFSDCNQAIYNKYNVTYTTTRPFFDNMMKNVDQLTKISQKKFRILVYNGDVDTVCNFIGDAKFIRTLAIDHKLSESTRLPWFFRKKTGGFVQSYTSSSIAIDVLTVKGAGHMVPMDRPGPALQMINGLMFANGDYNNTLGLNMSPTPIPLIDQTTTITTATRGCLSIQLSFIVSFVAFLSSLLFSN